LDLRCGQTLQVDENSRIHHLQVGKLVLGGPSATGSSRGFQLLDRASGNGVTNDMDMKGGVRCIKGSHQGFRLFEVEHEGALPPCRNAAASG
jgi:hypothetical protein